MESSHEYQIGTSAIALNGVWKELARMSEMVHSNVEKSFQAVEQEAPQLLGPVEEAEEYLDYLNKEISKYISHVIVYENNEKDSAQISAFFRVSGNLERIGDHAMNICEYTKRIAEKGISFSPAAKAEIAEMRKTSLAALDLLGNLQGISVERLSQVAAAEQKIDDMTLRYRQNQMDRIRDGLCSDEACVLYSEMLTDFERIGDHILNIGQELTQIDIPD